MATDQSEVKLKNFEARLKALDDRLKKLEATQEKMGDSMDNLQSSHAKVIANTKNLPHMVKTVNEIKKSQA